MSVCQKQEKATNDQHQPTPTTLRTQPDLGPIHHVLWPFGGVQLQPGGGVVVVGLRVLAFERPSFGAAATQRESGN